MVKPGILIIAADAALRATLARWLMQAGYSVELAGDPKRAREVASKAAIGLALVAPQGAPDIDLVNELTAMVDHVIIVGEPASGSGAADGPYARVGVPLNEADILAEVTSVLRTAPVQEAPFAAQPLGFEGYTLDAGARTCVDARGQEVALTRAEFSLLLAFAQKPGRVLSRDELTRVVTGRGAEPEDRSVDVLISRLRRKIETDPKIPRLIVTVPGEGYRFTAKTQAVAATEAAIEVQGTELKTASNPPTARQRPTTTLRMFGLAAGLAAVVIIAVVGWKAWSNREALQQAGNAPPPATAAELRPASTPASSREEQRATVFKRMVAAMQDNQFNWRTVERLAIVSGVDESEAHEILAEHPNEVVLGKSREGKLLAKLAGH